ncbi:hypothetical protein [Paenibacillus sp. AD87]|uniref:hypothetical protein n=1 Tax=Paenibacillus sp. AD87 TaxID=1528787 RepID=UPI0007E4A3FE|nr:hypothetical protein [Paenibacillus sp. AD87]OAX48479.1 hypothetical protein gpAD87_09925 [Paenibacillus sp. AD87]
MNKQSITYDLGTLPEGAKLYSVTASPTIMDGRQALRVTLTDEASKGEPNIDFIDMPTFLRIPGDFKNGTISVNLFSKLRDDAPPYARGFAGLAYRIGNSGDVFEAVYLRPLNGLKVKPESPRDKRAVQYFSYPNWKFDRLRQEYPDGRFEAGANIGPAEWINLTLEIAETYLTVFVDGAECMSLDKTKAEVTTGDIGLFVDIGTEAFFSELRITQR